MYVCTIHTLYNFYRKINYRVKKYRIEIFSKEEVGSHSPHPHPSLSWTNERKKDIQVGGGLSKGLEGIWSLARPELRTVSMGAYVEQ